MAGPPPIQAARIILIAAELAGLHDFVGLAVILAVALLVIDRDALGRVGLRAAAMHAAASGGVHAGGLLHEDVLLRVHGGFEVLGVQVGGRGDQHGVDVALRADPSSP